MQQETTDTTVALHSARHVLLCATDHESAASTNLLVDHVKDAGLHVKVIIASGSKPFVKHQLLDQSLDDEQEWYAWQKVGDEVMHIELTRWADLLVVAPCSANYLAKIANGLCDDLVMSVVRAWPPDKPVLLQLAMHTSMWQHPVTSQQLAVLNMQPNLHFVGTKNRVLQSVDPKLFQPEYGATCISSVVAAIQKLVGAEMYPKDVRQRWPSRHPSMRLVPTRTAVPLESDTLNDVARLLVSKIEQDPSIVVLKIRQKCITGYTTTVKL